MMNGSSSFLFLVVRPGAPSSFFALTQKLFSLQLAQAVEIQPKIVQEEAVGDPVGCHG